MRKIAKFIADLDNADRGWETLFQEIKAKSNEVRLSNKDAHLYDNRRRNRYRNVSPYDHSRVKLINGENDYINASLVKVPDITKRYILAQGPLQDTSGHFWQMVWEQNSMAVIMLNKVIENRMEKCFQYWPLEEEEIMEFTDDGFKIEVTQIEPKSTFTIRHIKLTNIPKEDSRNIYHFHYTTWPDFGVPESPTDFLEFLGDVRSLGVLEDDVGPAVLHCSAGIGRSGTFALVDACLTMAEQGIAFNATKVLLSMRNDRMGLIQTYQQLRFSYMAIAEGSKDFDEVEEEVIQEADDTKESEQSSEEEESESDESEENNGHLEDRKRHAEESSDEVQEAKKGKDTQDDPVDSILNNNKSQSTGYEENPNGIRQRIKSEKNEKLQEKLNLMRSKMKESEAKKDSPHSWLPYIFGGITVVGAICLAVKYYWY